EQRRAQRQRRPARWKRRLRRVKERDAGRLLFPERTMKAHRDANHGSGLEPGERLALLAKAQRSALQHAEWQRDDQAASPKGKALAVKTGGERGSAAPPVHRVHDRAEPQLRAAREQLAREPVK